MAFVLRPPSPSAREQGQDIEQEVDWALSSAFHASPFHPSSSHHASTSTAPTIHPPQPEHHENMGKEKERQLDIQLDTDTLFLKGTGVDVEPARLSGHVVLYLAESMSIKEITLQFRGKARLPVPPSESISLNNAPLNFMLCSYEWSFLEGEKKHSHRLKAGRHVFPFQLDIGGSLPSSISTSAGGGASIMYKLRAHVARPGFNHNLQTVVPVSVVRSFTPEALEYQQTLEIENTWPEKVMYSIMLPHKAWAAGDSVTAVVKLSPLAKGVRILTVTSTLHETTKLWGRSGLQESTAQVASIIHEFVGGVPVPVTRQELRRRSRRSSTASTPPHSATPSSSSMPLPPTPPNGRVLSAAFSMTAASTSSDSHSPPYALSRQPSPSASTSSAAMTVPEDDETPSEITTHLHIPVPINITPSHALEPICVSHRIRWSILIGNPDGHTSELRCSLPMHVLDPRLRDEARQYTAATHRVLLGDPESALDNTEDTELPSYNSHVRDRVANMFLPDAATLRVTNPWVLHGVSPVVTSQRAQVQAAFQAHSGAASPLDAPSLSRHAHLPAVPRSGESTPLDWVNSELLLSLQGTPPTSVQASYPFPDTQAESHASSPAASRLPTRPPTRPSSPERRASLANGTSVPRETFVHSSHGSRQLASLLTTSMKPLTSLPWRSSNSSSHTSLSTLAHADLSHPHSYLASLRQHPTHPAAQSAQSLANGAPPHQPHRAGSFPLPDPEVGSALLHRAFTEVPDYAVASRGFLGGVPPLTSMQGLPSYEEAERENGRPAGQALSDSPVSASPGA
ncbi:hypothetical protein HGRIS_002891 [Hohenbuehelia grisea]|uniref:Arrestin C-terminal-like domain-containing protein n=1 Tax=Hohenbuehelia grisea TaxID=104357 RepID=A0ABR3JNZ2_9AGAR